MSAEPSSLVTVGRVSGVHGVKGWIKVFSYTRPQDNVVGFNEWVLELRGQSQRVVVERGGRHGKRILAKLEGVDDRDAAALLIGATIAVERAALPECAPGEYYWSDLEGLEVYSVSGERLGRVSHLLAAGPHDVLVLEGGDDRLIPFVVGRVVREVDIAAGRIVAEWEASFWES